MQTEVKSIASEFCLDNWCKANLGRNIAMDNLVGFPELSRMWVVCTGL